MRTLRGLAFLTAALAALVGSGQAWPAQLPAGVSVESLVNGFSELTDIAFLSRRHTLIATKTGYVYLARNWAVDFANPPLIDLLSTQSLGTDFDHGLQSMAVHPDFLKDGKGGYLYLAYTYLPPNYCGSLWDFSIPGRLCSMTYNHIRRYLLRFNITSDGFDVVEDKLVFGQCTRALMHEGWWGEDCSPAAGNSHNIGRIWFGPDKKFYASIGDGMINEMDHWQTVWNKQVRTNRALPMDPNFLAGKILRMEADTPDGILGGLPDNPFYTGNMTLARAKVWAVGLRNPFRCSHLGSSDEIICGIVGSYSWEQITRVRRGANIGWPCWEAGNNRQPDYAPTTPVCKKMFADGAEAFGYVPVDHSSAIHIWVHNGTSACSIGGVTIPSYYPASLRNRYLFADYARNWIMAFNLADGSVAPFATDADGPITFKVSPFDGNIYYTSAIGEIRRFIVQGRGPKTTVKPASTASRAPTPTPGFCKPSGPALKPLAKEVDGQAWQTSMTLSKGEFPKSRMRVLLNGFAGKNIGMNTGVGIWNNSRLLRRNIAIGGEVFTAGLGTQGHSSIQLNFGKNTCWKFTAQVGIDDEIHVLGGVKKAFGEFAISSFADDRWKEVYSTTKDLAKEKRGPLKALQQAYPITVTNLSSVSSIRLIARRPNPLPLRFPQVNEHYDWAWAKLYCGPDAPYLPIPKIISPVGRAEYKIGDNVTCNGRATYYDGKTAITDPAMFSWNVLLMHCEGELCHTHWQTRGQGKSISFTVVDHGSLNQYYYFECELTVTDKCGRSDTVAKSIRIAGRTVMY